MIDMDEYGVPDYYYDDLYASEYEKTLEYIIKEAEKYGLSLDHYLLEFN
jgi:hypothetical protein